MNRQPVLEGERLLLRPLRAEDWDGLYAAASDPQIWVGHPAHDRWRESVFRGFFADALAKGGALAAIDKAAGKIVGSSRFQNHQPDNGGSVEIGWTFLARSHWGGTYNAEMKRLMLAHALGSVERVRFIVAADNAISRKAMTKIGGRLTGEREMRQMVSGPAEHVVFEIDRTSFAAGPLGASTHGSAE